MSDFDLEATVKRNCNALALINRRLELVEEKLKADNIASPKLPRAIELLKEAVKCQHNGVDTKGLCPQCKDAIIEFLGNYRANG